MKKNESKKNGIDQLYTLNLTVVALVALVAIVGLTAIVLNGGAKQDSSAMQQGENAAGQAYTSSAGDTRYLGPPIQDTGGDNDGGVISTQRIIRQLADCGPLSGGKQQNCRDCIGMMGKAYDTKTNDCA